MSRTFAVADVALDRAPYPPLARDAAVRKMLAVPVEQTSTSDARLVSCTDLHALVQAAHDAYFRHRPLVLSPDVVWFTLAQGFAHHVNLNAERLRHRFVRHEGKVKLVVVRPDFELGRENPWPEVFAAFSDQIAGHVGKLRDLVVADFSTTTPTARAASEVVLMDAFQAYFEYAVMCGCGIPSVTLLGTADDWRSIRRRAATLSEYELEPWTRELLPVLDRLVATAEGADDPDFWRSFFHYEGGSGPAHLTGWIHVLFPYLKDPYLQKLEPNPYLEGWSEDFRAKRRRRAGPHLGQIPSGLASAPLTVTDVRDGEEHAMRFVSGLFGVTEDPSTLALAPEMGWAIVHEPLVETRKSSR
jgi:hypothetical protein